MNGPLRLINGGLAPTAPTEEFLLGLPDVLDASCWFDEGKLKAHVTLCEGSKWTARALRVECALNIGIHQTPSEIQLVGSKLFAA